MPLAFLNGHLLSRQFKDCLIVGTRTWLSTLACKVRGISIGTGIGHALSWIICGVGRLASGGFLPRRLRRTIAMNFTESQPDTALTMYPNLGQEKLLKMLEKQIEIISTRAIADN